MNRYLGHLVIKSYITSIIEHILPINKKNIVAYLTALFVTIILAFPTKSSTFDQILCADELNYRLLHLQYEKFTFEQYMILKMSCVKYSKKTIVPVRIMCAIVNNESEWSTTAVSATGDYGPFQINAYHQYRGKDPRDLFDFALSAKLAVSYYSECYNYALKIYGKRGWAESFRFYNGGMSNIKDNYDNWDYVGAIVYDIDTSLNVADNLYSSYSNIALVESNRLWKKDILREN